MIWRSKVWNSQTWNLVNFCQTTRRQIAADCNIRSHNHVNLMNELPSSQKPASVPYPEQTNPIPTPTLFVWIRMILCCTSKSSNWSPTLLVFRLNRWIFVSLMRDTCIDHLLPSWFDRPNNDVSGEKEVSCSSPYSVLASSQTCLVISIVSNARNLRFVVSRSETWLVNIVYERTGIVLSLGHCMPELFLKIGCLLEQLVLILWWWCPRC
jgi:hypothetical protein